MIEHARAIVLVPAAGGGRRFGGNAPKQYALLGARAVLACTLDRLAAALSPMPIVVALAPDDRHYDAAIGARDGVETLRCGGGTRAATVANALAALAKRCGDDDWILVHDAARPCVPVDAILRLVSEIAREPVGGLLAIPAGDTLKREDSAHPGRVLHTEDRRGIWQAQTPQMFRYGILRAAYALPGTHATTDDAQAVEALAATGACAQPRLVVGSAQNVKVTYPSDLALARAILATQEGSS
ncbi:MAG: 2-C-methyl-D-erythritol 4-phosphate cytidylyltransferase [Casimicrobiaceae bacterium]